MGSWHATPIWLRLLACALIAAAVTVLLLAVLDWPDEDDDNPGPPLGGTT